MAKSKALSDTDLLAILKEERQNSIGFENDAELSNDRARALEYAQGKMPDIPAQPRRSKVVDTAIADAVETVLPDLIEIFLGGDDPITFTPQGEEDVEAAQQETDYIRHVAFQQNPGFLNLYTAFKDALLVKSGIWKIWWDEYEEVEEERHEGKTGAELSWAKAQEGVEVDDIEEAEAEPLILDGQTYDPEPLYNFTVRSTVKRGSACYRAFPPEDFTVAPDTVWLPDATYCAGRTRNRVQDLIADGYDAAQVRNLPPVHGVDDDTVSQARDTAGETDRGSGSDRGDLKTVEIVEHYIRLDVDGDGKPKLWRIVTGAEESVLLEKGQVSRIGYADIKPYIVAHRFYGESLADKLIEVQRIKTVLKRMLLDSGYFALNQRLEVAEERSSANTIPDLLRNEPGVPVRSRSGDAVRAIGGGGLSFDVAGALEYFETVAEQATGVARSAQGLNPDTLHETAKGAIALMGMAQRRIRMIARIFAETGVKDLFLCMHDLIRQHASASSMARLRNTWVPVDPTAWGLRKDMTIEIGVGSGGKEMTLAVMQQVLSLQERIADQQGGLSGPLVTGDNVYAALTRFCEAGGLKAPENYFSDPAQMQEQPGEEQPDPDMIEAQMKIELEREKAQAEMELEQFKAQQEAALAQEQQEFEQRMATERAQFEARLAERKAEFNAMLAASRAAQPRQVPMYRPGGRLDA